MEGGGEGQERGAPPSLPKVSCKAPTQARGHFSRKETGNLPEEKGWMALLAPPRHSSGTAAQMLLITSSGVVGAGNDGGGGEANATEQFPPHRQQPCPATAPETSRLLRAQLRRKSYAGSTEKEAGGRVGGRRESGRTVPT